jgi:hypothetical protein
MPRVPKLIGWPLLGAFSYGVMYFFVQRSIYFPFQYPQGFWQVQGQLGAGDVWLRTSDGVRLHGWWLAPPEARVVTLFLHGNAGNVTHRAGHIQEITAAGSALLVLDYRGYGRSEGRPTEKGLYADAEAAYQHLLAAGYRPEQIVLHGESLGSAVAVELAARRPCGGVVLEAPFTSAREVAGRVLPVLGPLLIWSYNSKEKIGRIRAPLLVMHGERDEVVPFDLGRALFQAAREPKAFWAVPGAGHNDLVPSAGAAYRQRLRAFYQGLRRTT